jgi:hypothetical protein
MNVALRQIWRSKVSWAYLQVLIELLFCLTKLLNMAMAWNFVVMLGQTLKRSVYNSVILRSYLLNFIKLYCISHRNVICNSEACICISCRPEIS